MNCPCNGGGYSMFLSLQLTKKGTLQKSGLSRKELTHYDLKKIYRGVLHVAYKKGLSHGLTRRKSWH